MQLSLYLDTGKESYLAVWFVWTLLLDISCDSVITAVAGSGCTPHAALHPASAVIALAPTSTSTAVDTTLGARLYAFVSAVTTRSTKPSSSTASSSANQADALGAWQPTAAPAHPMQTPIQTPMQPPMQTPLQPPLQTPRLTPLPDSTSASRSEVTARQPEAASGSSSAASLALPWPRKTQVLLPEATDAQVRKSQAGGVHRSHGGFPNCIMPPAAGLFFVLAYFDGADSICMYAFGQVVLRQHHLLCPLKTSSLQISKSVVA